MNNPKQLFWKAFMKTAKVNKLSKYEKKFIVFDLLFTSGTYGKAKGMIIWIPNTITFVSAIAIILFNAWIRKLVWNGMEWKEKAEILSDKESLFNAFKKEGIVGDKAVGQWQNIP